MEHGRERVRELESSINGVGQILLPDWNLARAMNARRKLVLAADETWMRKQARTAARHAALCGPAVASARAGSRRAHVRLLRGL